MSLDPIDDWYNDYHNVRAFEQQEQIAAGLLSVTEHEGIKLVGAHEPETCAGETCVIHNQTDHSMRSFELTWRADRAIFERICPHGIGHPDPDQFEFWKKTDQMVEAVHGCDGCCR